MAPLWIISVFLFSTSSAQNQNCSKRDFPAPVFGAGENLSAAKCGIWDQQTSKNAPWYALIGKGGSSACEATLISPTTLLTYFCGSEAEEFLKSENKDDWKADLGKCAVSNECAENGQGQVVKIKSVTKLNAPGLPDPIHIWKIEKATLKENSIAPICIFNKGNGQDFQQKQQYTAFYYDWSREYQHSVQLKEDFGPCLNRSRDFKTCDKVQENFLCTRFPEEDGLMYYLNLKENNRHFLRALLVELISSRDRFYYEIVPLLEQIASVGGDIPLMPTTSN